MTDGRQLRFMFLPDGEDPDTLVRKEGKEAFDKPAKLLGLDYPGGPLLSKMAAQGTACLLYTSPEPVSSAPATH